MDILPFYSLSAHVLTFLLLTTSRGVISAKFTFVNRCEDTVWPGNLANIGSPQFNPTGFELPKDACSSFNAPTGWSGRFWARTNCTFDESGSGACITGDCGGSFECNGIGASPPVTLAEFTLGSGSQDFYDVSLVDGYNLPVLVESSGGSGSCGSTGCVADLNRECPTELRANSGGACRSACGAFGRPEYCCTGDYGSPATCRPSCYSEKFKMACPSSYTYAYDDATSTFTCTGADYTVTFCPSSTSEKPSLDPQPAGPGLGTNFGSETGSGAGRMVSNSGAESQSGAAMADGSWLARLAMGDSTRLNNPSILLIAYAAFSSLIFSIYL